MRRRDLLKMKTRVPKWAIDAEEELRAGRKVLLKPRGNSMKERVRDGELVTVAPCRIQELEVGEIVLARVPGKRYLHIVLHQILERNSERFLIGSSSGKIDGWSEANDVFGKKLIE